ncbi:MAG TPA: HAMP domain-containing sensor histidine kinase [Pyrinomonadaceae bacterium]|nr:HAMP domain-containing histidine kinase [Chloracidobacterium sp.]HRJ89814.1 HAMP domain-containing sensor histidine kinase [Pyrinomonadaceae bacterium]HRK51011.1 HAMP domain-containing sensor histidine kinase [Pyrinomonadaceae bacterium]
MRRRKTAIFFLVLGIALSVLAVALNVGWILLNLRQVALLILGIVFFALIITGLILNTVFLVREIRRSEQHDAFLNSVTHELKTPIASIKLYLETLKSREVTKEKQHEFYDIMLSDADRLLNTVEQVLQAGRLREKRLQYDVTEIDIQEVIRNAISAVLSRYNLSPGVFRYYGPDEHLPVLGDYRELETAFINLFDNAVKYSAGEPNVSVRVRRMDMKDRVAIRIRDNGVGIPDADLKRIFKRFYRSTTPLVKETKGTGLGLFIVRSIIENHGGSIRADSKGEGKGTTILVQLPLL